MIVAALVFLDAVAIAAVTVVVTRSVRGGLLGAALGGIVGLVAEVARIAIAMKVSALLPADVSPDALLVWLINFRLMNVSVVAGVGILAGQVAPQPPSSADSRDGDQRSQPVGRRGWIRLTLRSVPGVALGLSALVAAGLVTANYLRYRPTDLGFDNVDVVTMRVSLPPDLGADPVQRNGVLRSLKERLQILPGMQGVCASTALPFVGRPATVALEMERPDSPGAEPDTSALVAVSPDFFGVLGIPVLRGRSLGDSDNAASPQVVVIDEAFARRITPGQDPIGRRVLLEHTRTPWDIVGVVGNVQQSFTGGNQPHLYVSLSQTPLALSELQIAVRSSRGVAEVRHAVASTDHRVTVSDAMAMDRRLSDAFVSLRFTVLFGSAPAGVALLLVLALAISLARRGADRVKDVPMGPTKCPACLHTFIPPRVTLTTAAIAARYGPYPMQCPRCQHIWSR